MEQFLIDEHVQLQQLIDQSRRVQLFEVIRKIEQQIKQRAQIEQSGMVSREMAFEIIKSFNFFGKEMFSSDEILKQIEENSFKYVGDTPIIESEKGQYTETPLDESFAAQLFADYYMEQGTQEQGKSLAPDKFLKYIQDKANSKDGVDKVNTLAVAGVMEKDKQRFEQNERAAYEDWFITSLKQENENDNQENKTDKKSNYDIAVKHISYCGEDDIQIAKIPADENRGRPAAVAFSYRPHAQSVLEKHTEANTLDRVVFKTVPIDVLREKNINGDDLEVFDGKEINEWHNADNEIETLQNLLYRLDDSNKQKKSNSTNEQEYTRS